MSTGGGVIFLRHKLNKSRGVLLLFFLYDSITHSDFISLAVTQVNMSATQFCSLPFSLLPALCLRRFSIYQKTRQCVIRCGGWQPSNTCLYWVKVKVKPMHLLAPRQTSLLARHTWAFLFLLLLLLLRDGRPRGFPLVYRAGGDWPRTGQGSNRHSACNYSRAQRHCIPWSPVDSVHTVFWKNVVVYLGAASACLGLGKKNRLINALRYLFFQFNIDFENSDIDSYNHVVLHVE